MKWKKTFWQPIYRTNGIEFRTIEADAGGGTFVYTDSSGAYEVAFEWSVLPEIFEIPLQHIKPLYLNGKVNIEAKRREIFENIRDCYRQIRHMDVGIQATSDPNVTPNKVPG